eukprot:GAHX01000799.1.p1 GENE.GAHX01000799.1~~GAHX01000799.1.p1  ORF type:complete len:1565 (+),score=320.33 GAHX01000799.1:36-4730(+)
MKNIKKFTKKAYHQIAQHHTNSEGETPIPKDKKPNRKLSKTTKQTATLSEHESLDNSSSEEILESATSFTPGQYSIQVHILECRDLHGISFSDSADPRVIISLADEKRKTRTKHKTLNPVYDELFTFETDLSLKEFEASSINISVFNSSILKQGLIGLFMLDLSMVYYQPDKLINNKWVAIYDPTFKRKGIQGFVRLSVCMQSEDSDFISLLDPELLLNNEESEVMMPPCIKETPKTVVINISEFKDCDKALSLSKTLLAKSSSDYIKNLGSSLSTSDKSLYLKTKFLGTKLKTKRMAAKDTIINQQFLIPVQEPIMAKHINLELWRHKLVGKSHSKAKVVLAYPPDEHKDSKSIVNFGETFKSPKWINLYGKIAGFGGEMYMGRILAHAYMQDEFSSAGVLPVTAIDKNLRPPFINYSFACDVYEVTEVFTGRYFITINCGSMNLNTKQIKGVNGKVQFYETLSSTIDAPVDFAQCPDVFVYISDSKGPLGFIRKKLSDIVTKGWDCTPHRFLFNRFCKREKWEFPGDLLINIRAGFTNTKPAVLIDTVSLSNKHINDTKDSGNAIRNGDEDGTLVVDVKNISQLLDKHEKSQYKGVYVELQVGSDSFDSSRKRRTRISNDLMNPMFSEQFEIDNIGAEEKVLFRAYVLSKSLNGKSPILLFEFLSNLKDLKASAKVGDGAWEADYELEVPSNCFKTESSKTRKTAALMKFNVKYYEAIPLEHLELDEDHQEDEHGKSKKKNKIEKPMFTSYQLRVLLYQARNLPPCESNGLSDPYIVIKCGGKQMISPIISKSLYPDWFTTFAMVVDLPCAEKPSTNSEYKESANWSLCPNVHIFCWDKHNSSIHGKDILIGYCKENMASIALNTHKNNLSPFWRPLELNAANSEILGDTKKKKQGKLSKLFRLKANLEEQEKIIEHGQLLIGFQIIPKPQSTLYPVFELSPPSIEMQLNIFFVGLRNIAAGFKLNKPFARFHMSNDKRYDSKRSCVPDKQNPNFLELIQLRIKVPENDLFSPTLRIEAVDSSLGGFVHKVIGRCHINVHQFLNQQTSNRKSKYIDTINLNQDGADDSATIKMEESTSESSYSEADDSLTEISYKEEMEEYLVDRISYKKPLDYYIKDSVFSHAALSYNNKQVGVFKGIFKLKGLNDDPLSVDNKEELSEEEILQKKQLTIRVYVLKAYNVNSDHPTFLLCNLNGESRRVDEAGYGHSLNPLFHECFEFEATLPGVSDLNVSVHENNKKGSLIGKTSIDLEERFYSNTWREYKNKPIELRKLYDINSKRSKGYMEMWVDIFESPAPMMIDIRLPPPKQYDLRVVVWSTRNVAIKDTITEMTDIFVKGNLILPSNEKLSKDEQIHWSQRTDIHYRAESGVGNFNWRFIFKDIQLPLNESMIQPRLNLQLWDKDLFSPNDAICETNINLSHLLKSANNSRTCKNYNFEHFGENKHIEVSGMQEGLQRFWVKDLTHPNFEGNQGEVEISVELVDKEYARVNPAGMGRSEPNQSPFLEKPEGRKKFSILHPFTTLKNMLGPKLIRKLLCYFILIFIVFVLIATGPLWIMLLFGKLL